MQMTLPVGFCFVRAPHWYRAEKLKFEAFGLLFHVVAKSMRSLRLRDEQFSSVLVHLVQCLSV